MGCVGVNLYICLNVECMLSASNNIVLVRIIKHVLEDYFRRLLLNSVLASITHDLNIQHK